MVSICPQVIDCESDEGRLKQIEIKGDDVNKVTTDIETQKFPSYLKCDPINYMTSVLEIKPTKKPM